MDFGENWESQEGDFVKTLDEMFNLKNSGASIGGGAAALTQGMNSITQLPGLTEGLQLEILKQLGFTDADSKNLPQGNPNLINEAQVRKVGGGGLSSNISLNFKTIYEQKFINNIDPELIFLDIIGNALRFGTSKSEFYITGKAGGKIKDFFKKTFSGDFIGAITIIISTIIDALASFVNLVKQATDNFASKASTGLKGTGDALSSLGSAALAPILSKYKVKLSGILSALTGEPSTPWHVTIGNPKKPIFSSGDMLVHKVNIKFGDVLAFNDLPSTVEIDFEMSGARAYGLQEIFDKFNCGAGRSYIAVPSNFETQITGNAGPSNPSGLALSNAQVITMADNNSDTSSLSDGDKARVESARKRKTGRTS